MSAKWFATGCVSVGLALLAGCGQSVPSPTGPGVSQSTRVSPSPGTERRSRGESEVAISDENRADWLRQIERVITGESVAIEAPYPVDDAMVARLPDAGAKLADLLLDGGGLSDANIELVTQCSALEHLRIRLSPLSDSSLQLIAERLPSLQILNLPHAFITADGIRKLAGLPRLRQLRLGGKQLDDDAASAAAELPMLQSLHLIGPKLTGLGLTHLQSAPRLASLYIDDCQLPDEAWVELFRVKPNLHVHIDQHHHDRDPNADSHGD